MGRFTPLYLSFLIITEAAENRWDKPDRTGEALERHMEPRKRPQKLAVLTAATKWLGRGEARESVRGPGQGPVAGHQIDRTGPVKSGGPRFESNPADH